MGYMITLFLRCHHQHSVLVHAEMVHLLSHRLAVTRCLMFCFILFIYLVLQSLLE